MPDTPLAVESRPPGELIPYDRNAKQHPPAQVQSIANSIREFGFDQPIVVDESDVILKGHGRREAALLLGLEVVPVVVRRGLSDADKEAARIADNRTAESPWDEGMLLAEIGSLRDQDFDLSLLGFEPWEMDRMLTKLDQDTDDLAGLGAALESDDDPDPEPEDSRQSPNSSENSGASPTNAASNSTEQGSSADEQENTPSTDPDTPPVKPVPLYLVLEPDEVAWWKKLKGRRPDRAFLLHLLGMEQARRDAEREAPDTDESDETTEEEMA